VSDQTRTANTAFSSSYKWWVVLMVWFICFFNYADRQATSSVLPLLSKNFGFDDFQLGIIGSAFAWIYAAMSPFAGMAADRTSRKKLIIAACVIWSFFTLATAWCGNFSSFVTVRALTGLAETFYFPAAMALISDFHGPATRSRAMSFHQSAVYVGTILGSWLAAVLAERSKWNVPFMVFGPIGILLALLISKFLQEPPRGMAENHVVGMPASIPETLKIIFSAPVALLLMTAFVCANFVAFIFLTWMPAFLFNKFHYSLGAAGLTGAIFINLASAMSVPIAGLLADKWSRRFAGGRMLVQLLGLLVGATFVFLVGKTESIGILIIAMTCFGVCKGFYDSGIFASLYDTIEPRARGTAAGLMNTVGWGGGALGPIFVGYMSKYKRQGSEIKNMSDAIAFGGVIYLVAAVLIASAFFCFARRHPQVEPV
jgi:MFS family permease